MHLGDLRGVWYCLFWKFDVESQHDNKNQDRNNGANNTLVPVHPFRHVRQNFLALAYVIRREYDPSEDQTVCDLSFTTTIAELHFHVYS